MGINQYLRNNGGETSFLEMKEMKECIWELCIKDWGETDAQGIFQLENTCSLGQMTEARKGDQETHNTQIMMATWQDDLHWKWKQRTIPTTFYITLVRFIS